MKNLLLVFSILCLTVKTSAQIIYTDIIPDATISSSYCYTFHLANASPSYLGYGTINIWFHLLAKNEVLALNGTDCQIMVNSTSDKLPLKLEANDTINSAKTWANVSYNPLNIGNSQGLWLGGVSNKYLGIRFKLTPGSSWLYGWARLDVDANPDSFTVKDYAYNSETGSNEILAGQISNTGIKEGQHLISSFCFPDASGNSMVIKFSNPERKRHTISIYNVNGQLLQKVESNIIEELSVDSRNWESGIYFYRLQNQNGKTGQGKFILE
jgi:hypothetical protein